MRSATLWAALALPALLAACAKPPAPTVTSSRLPVYAVDLQGKASLCTVPNDQPRLTDAQQTEIAMTIGNDGGWCGANVSKPGPEPFDAGLLTARPANGRARVQSVGDYTRLDYIPDPGFTGTDSFTVRLLPGSTSVKVNVTVQAVAPAATPAAAPAAAAPVVTPRVTAPPATSNTSPRSSGSSNTRRSTTNR